MAGGLGRIVVAAALVLGGLALVPAHLAGADVPATVDAHGSVEQVYVMHLTPGDALELRQGGTVKQTGTVDDLGSFLFHNVTPGDNYTVFDATLSATSAALHVMTQSETPPSTLYTSQHLVNGFQYITTRDGTKLGANVTLPSGPGPFPTVIEYSGYDPSHPGHPQPSTQIAQLLGYATVGVNVRGTGCSGGAFSFFEPLQGLDGYDVVEAVAAQSWVLHGKPGMVGISYPGIAQTFTGPTQPPHLAALAPLSVVADTYESLSYPGGIPNVGFPREWAQERDDQAKPLGQGWEQSVIDGGGTIGAQCADNQKLRHENTSLVSTFDAHAYREPVADADTLSPMKLDSLINVPTFMGGAWQDEQTGGASSLIWPNLTSVPKGKLHVFGTNGTHVDSLVAELNRWFEFLEFYVAQRIPKVPASVRAIAPIIFQQATGITNVQLEPDRFTKYTTYSAALAAYEKEPPIRILFENGAGNTSNLGAPFGTYEAHFSSWPPANTAPTTWYFQPDQKLAASAPAIADTAGNASTSYVYDPTAKPATDFHGSTSDIWAAHPNFDWRALPLGKALAFDSPALSSTTVMAGPGSVDLWLKSTAPDTDVEVTLTELRPDGKEIYIQNGWLRASHRATTGASTALQPLRTETSADAAPLPAGEFSEARVALLPFAHIFRKGSRLRISVEAPGGNRPFWAFGALAGGSTVNDIAHSTGHPSKIVLPVIPGLTGIPAKYPPCGSVRGEPCRTIVSNGAATKVKAAPNGSSAIVSWAAAVPRSGNALTKYVVTDATTGAMQAVATAATGSAQDVAAKETSVQIDDLAVGTHHFVVTAVYASGAKVASTPSNDVDTDTTPPTTSTTTTSTSTTTSTVAVAGEGSTSTTVAALPVSATSDTSGSGGTLPFTGTGAALAGIGVLCLAIGALLAGRRRKPTL